MLDILKETIEWKSWGWNAPTLTFLLTVLFTVIDGWGYKKQGETIWEKKSAESVSAITFFYGAGLCYSYAIYALFVGSIAILFNGLILGYFLIPILRGLLKFKGLKSVEKIICASFFLMIPAMIFLPHKGAMFFFFMLAGLLPLAAQPLEIWRNKKAGDVDIRSMTVFALGVFFWAGYGFFASRSSQVNAAEAGLVVVIVNSIAFLLFGVIIFLWFKYQEEPLTFRKFCLFFLEKSSEKKKKGGGSD